MSLAVSLGWSLSYLAAVERGSSVPTVFKAIELADKLGTQVESIEWGKVKKD